MPNRATNQNENLNPQYIDESSIHTYRTEIPNIIFELGLKANQLAVYLAIKRSSGDKGKCTKSNKKLAKEAGVSEKVLCDIKKILSKVNPLLKKPFIKITKRTSKEGDYDTDLITIVDIWPENMRFFLEKKEKREAGGGVENAGTPKNDGTPKKLSEEGGVENDPRVGSKSPVKEEPFKKEPIYINTTTTTNNEIQQLQISENVGGGGVEKSFGVGDLFYKDTRAEVRSITQSDIYRHFVKFSFPTEIVQSAIEEVRKSNDLIGNIFRYLEAICMRLVNQQIHTKKEIKIHSEQPPEDVIKPSQEVEKASVGELLKQKRKQNRDEKKNDKT